MKKVILFIILSIIYSGLLSQNLELRVLSSLEEPLPYSYIFINNKYYGDADSCGVIVIPDSLIKKGDTISVKYVGAKDNSFIYSHKISVAKTHTISLEQSVNLNEIIVSSSKENSKKLFSKYVNTPFIGSWFDHFFGDFEIVIMINNRLLHKINGGFKYELLSPDFKKNNKVDDFSFTALSDTVGYSKLLYKCMEIYSMAHYEIVLWKGASMNKKMHIKYMGENGDNHVFMINRPAVNNKLNGVETSQLLIFVNKKSKNPVSAEIIKIFTVGSYPEYNLNVEYSTVFNKFNMIFPSKIGGQFSFYNRDEKIVCDISMSNIYYSKPTKTKK
ncbi:MAG: hypothetical protein LLF93_05850 [Bacteroidales bacterium]|nr:hypothetical protein [Bacteroidales bacterium]